MQGMDMLLKNMPRPRPCTFLQIFKGPFGNQTWRGKINITFIDFSPFKPPLVGDFPATFE